MATRARPKPRPRPYWGRKGDSILGLVQLSADANNLIAKIRATDVGPDNPARPARSWLECLEATSLDDHDMRLLEIGEAYFIAQHPAMAAHLTESLARVAWAVIRGTMSAERALERASWQRAAFEHAKRASDGTPLDPLWTITRKANGETVRAPVSAEVIVAAANRPRRDTSEELAVWRVYLTLAEGSIAVQGNRTRGALDGPLRKVIERTRPKV